MENTSIGKISEIIEEQRKYFRSNATLDLGFRKEMLHRLDRAIVKWEPELYRALQVDLHKSREEAYLTEISIVRGELRKHLNNLKKWAKPEYRWGSLAIWPSKSQVVCEPLGNALIVSPWNYPVHLLLNPLVGAISSGCTAVLKPSPYVPEVSKVLESLIEDTFEERYVAMVQGNREVNTELFSHRFDFIFLTGSPQLGRIAMEAASRFLTPLVLELGGKSPCIVDETANVELAAKRIAWGKTMNSGQTCIAPDYLFVHEKVKSQFVEAFQRNLHLLHGKDIEQSGHYCRMVNDKAFARVSSYLKEGKILCGGRVDAASRYIEPTLLEVTDVNQPVMQEEIFGPVFPVMTYTDIQEAIDFARGREKPLALYYFGNRKDGWNVIRQVSSGGACINDTLMHIANDNIPFGGVGNAGMGRYHGKDTFLAFSHVRSVVTSCKWLDMPFRYMPYKWFNVIKHLL